jgi:hypothetical protein
VQDAILALSEDIDPIMLTLSRSAGHLPSPIHPANKNKVPAKPEVSNSKISNHASTSSLKSDKSDTNVNLRRDQRQSGSALKPHGVLRDIFRVKLPRKKLSSPEVEILETLDSAIASGGSSSTQRKTRRKRASSRNSGAENSSNKNGTWPRVMLNRNSACSYTLPHSGAPESGSGSRGNEYAAIIPHHGKSESASFYSGQYIPNPNGSSNTVCVRRPSSGKERAPLSSLTWDVGQQLQQQQQQQHGGGSAINSKSVGAINMNLGLGIHRNDPTPHGLIGNVKSATMTRSRPGFLDSTSGHNVGGGLILSQASVGTSMHNTPQPPHHRYSFGVFDPSASSSGGKIGKL